jgi:hypothetical protein
VRYPVRGLDDGLLYFARVTAVDRAGLNASADGLPIRVDAAGCVVCCGLCA